MKNVKKYGKRRTTFLSTVFVVLLLVVSFFTQYTFGQEYWNKHQHGQTISQRLGCDLVVEADVWAHSEIVEYKEKIIDHKGNGSAYVRTKIINLGRLFGVDVESQRCTSEGHNSYRAWYYYEGVFWGGMFYIGKIDTWRYEAQAEVIIADPPTSYVPTVIAKAQSTSNEIVNWKLLDTNFFSSGANIGDWAKYVHNSTDPRLSEIEYGKFTVQNIVGTNITAEVLTHFLNGTENTELLWVDTVSGNGTAAFMWIRPGLSPGDRIYDATESPVINGTTVRNYKGVNREVVYTDLLLDGHPLKAYWDRATGLITELTAPTPDVWSAYYEAVPTEYIHAVMLVVIVVVVVAVVIIVVVAIAGYLYMKRRKK